jgi:hypothetical protein
VVRETVAAAVVAATLAVMVFAAFQMKAVAQAVVALTSAAITFAVIPDRFAAMAAACGHV